MDMSSTKLGVIFQKLACHACSSCIWFDKKKYYKKVTTLCITLQYIDSNVHIIINKEQWSTKHKEVIVN